MLGEEIWIDLGGRMRLREKSAPRGNLDSSPVTTTVQADGGVNSSQAASDEENIVLGRDSIQGPGRPHVLDIARLLKKRMMGMQGISGREIAQGEHEKVNRPLIAPVVHESSGVLRRDVLFHPSAKMPERATWLGDPKAFFQGGT
jgi:hypothetical protein